MDDAKKQVHQERRTTTEKSTHMPQMTSQEPRRTFGEWYLVGQRNENA